MHLINHTKARWIYDVRYMIYDFFTPPFNQHYPSIEYLQNNKAIKQYSNFGHLLTNFLLKNRNTPLLEFYSTDEGQGKPIYINLSLHLVF